jgi:hypothetical protein
MSSIPLNKICERCDRNFITYIDGQTTCNDCLIKPRRRIPIEINSQEIKIESFPDYAPIPDQNLSEIEDMSDTTQGLSEIEDVSDTTQS